jgi:hypothetical protein
MVDLLFSDFDEYPTCFDPGGDPIHIDPIAYKDHIRRWYNQQLQDNYQADPSQIRQYQRDMLCLTFYLRAHLTRHRTQRCFDAQQLLPYSLYEQMLEATSLTIERIIEKTIKK